MKNRVVRFKLGQYICPYCNERPGIEKEHVIPRGFFYSDDNGSRIIVPACGECNDRFSNDEEYVRMVFSMEFRGGTHPTACALMDGGKAYRALQQNQKLQKSIVDTLHEVTVRTHGGIELPGTYHAFVPERQRIDRFIEKIVRGVFFAETSERFPMDYSVQYWTEDKLDISLLPELLDALLSEPIGIVGNNIFQYRFVRTSDDPMSTVWIMRFYEGIMHIAITKAKENELSDIEGDRSANDAASNTILFRNGELANNGDFGER